MTQYILKSTLVLELERRIKRCAKQREDMLNVHCHTLADDASARMGELRCFQDFLDTLEVKDLELGIKKSVNESIIRKIVDLNNEAAKHYDAVIKKEREENGFSQLAIDLFDHKVDANELRIQYIIENLKAQKGE